MKYLLLSLLFSAKLFAAGGYDKQSLWSAKSAALGGAVASVTSKSEALLFNPAGISDNEVSVHYGGYWGYLKAPITSSGHQTRTAAYPIHAPALVVSHKLSDKFSVALGYYALAGLDVHYKDVSYAGVDPALSNYKKDYFGKLDLIEYSLGLSYKMNEQFKFGVALRGQSIEGSFQQSQIVRDSASNAVLGIQTAKFSNLKDNQFGSYRAGIQFLDESKTWGLGATYRSDVSFRTKGKLTGEFAGATASGAGGAVTPSVGSSARVNGLLPKKFDLDGHYNLNEKITLLLGYSWTEYKLAKKLDIKGSLDGNPVPDNIQNWHNLNEYKIGIEIRKFEFATYRAGYARSSQVTNDKYTSANAAVPSTYHHYGIGLSKNLTEQLSLDSALEYYYSVGKGKTEATDNGTFAVNSLQGNAMTEVWGLFVGLKYQY